MLLKALAKSNGSFLLSPLRARTIAIAIVERAINLEIEPTKKKQRTDIKGAIGKNE